MEKLILGAGLLVLGVVGFFYIVGNPYQVEIKTAKGPTVEAGPSDVEDHVLDAVEQLKVKLDSGDPGFDEPVIPKYKDTFATTYGAVPLEMYQFAKLNHGGPDLTGGGTLDDRIWTLPNVPMPLNVVAEADYGLIDFDRVFNPNVLAGIQQLVGARVPADVRYAKVGAEFNMDAWAAAFEAIPLDNRVPDLIYRNSLHVAGVYLKRQELNPVTKRWENETDIEPLPGQIAFLPGDGRQFDRAAGEEAVALIKTSQEQIARPPFVPLADARPWLPPGVAGPKLDFEQQQELNNIIRKIANMERRVLALRKQLGMPEQLPAGGQMAPVERPRGGEEWNEMEMGDRRPPQPRRAADGQSARLADLENQLIELYRQRDELQRAADPNAVALPEGAGADEVPQEVLDQMTPQQRREWFETGRLPGELRSGGQPGGPRGAGRVRVWAHDLTVEPGKTYRYKLVVAVLNPLFQNRQLRPDQAEANRHRIALQPERFEVQAAEWSDPVEIEPRHHFFVVSGNPGGHSAEVEVYTIFNGVRQREKFIVSPGDPIGQVVQRQVAGGQVFQIDMRVGAFAVDIVSTPGTGGAGIGTARMLYQWDGSNRIAARDIANDKNSKLREELQYEVNEAEQARADQP